MPMSKRGPRRDRKQFPYEAQVVGGKLLMPADLQRLHRFMLETEVRPTALVSVAARPRRKTCIVCRRRLHVPHWCGAKPSPLFGIMKARGVI